MPGALGSKINVIENAEGMNGRLREVMEEGDIPTFFGGGADHDKYYPDEGFGKAVDIDALGSGCLLFDYPGMMKRQKGMLADWIAENGRSEEDEEDNGGGEKGGEKGTV